MRRSIVLFALNEVPWEVLDDYVAARPTVSVDHLASYAFYLPDAFASEPGAGRLPAVQPRHVDDYEQLGLGQD